MQKAFDEIIDRFNQRKSLWENVEDRESANRHIATWNKAIKIVNQVAEEMGVSKMESTNEEVCEWRLCDEEANVYDTTCRNPHILLKGSPIDNNYEFCPYCGKKIKVIGD